ncbi:MAG: cation:proton antiporter [Thermoplasmatota archaeon]
MNTLPSPSAEAIASGSASGYDAGQFLRGFTSLLSVSLALGFAGGLLWIIALRRLKGHPHSYMLTFAVMLGTYGLSEFLGGSGAMSTLIFGLILGNRTFLLKRFGRVRDVDDEHEKVQAFHDEVAFFVRTSFFLFLGASFSFGLSGRWEAASLVPGFSALDHTTGLLVLGSFLMLAGVIAARGIATWAVAGRRHPARRQLFPVFGRGLDTAVLATVPFLATSYTKGDAYAALFGPWKPVFLNLSLYVVLFTVVASGLAVYWYEHGLPPEAVRPARQPERGPEVAVPRPRAPPRAPPVPPARRAGK